MQSENAALRFHRHTEHSRRRVLRHQTKRWMGYPGAVKKYPDAPTFSLQPPQHIGLSLADIVKGNLPGQSDPLGIDEISTLLFLSYGIVREARFPGERFKFRAAPSAGALYPAEHYLCCGETDGIDAGIYYYDPHANALVLVREGDYRKAVSAHLCENVTAQAYLLVTAIPARSARRYAQRAVRYCLLDGGHLVGNLILTGAALGLDPFLVTDFGEDYLSSLLDLMPEQEILMAVVPIVRGARDLPESPGLSDPVEDSSFKTGYQGKKASELRSLLQSEAGKAEPNLNKSEAADRDGSISIEPVFPAGPGIGELIRKRSSYRGSSRRPLPRQNLFEYLNTVCLAYPADWMPVGRQQNPLPDIRLAVFNVEDIPPAIYSLDAASGFMTPDPMRLEPSAVVQSCMGQGFVAKSNALLVLTLDFEIIRSDYAYRVAALDAGIVGQLAYLAAETLGAGCCGIGAFFDDELTETLGLNYQHQAALYALTLALR